MKTIRSSKAFTLVELLIVVAIIAVLSVPTAHFIGEINRLTGETLLTAESIEDGEAFAGAWAADAGRASGAILQNPGALSFEMTGVDGVVRLTHYVFENGVLARYDASNEAPSLKLEGVSRVEFKPEGRGWRCSFTMERTTGRRDFAWTFERIATPILAGTEAGS